MMLASKLFRLLAAAIPGVLLMQPVAADTGVDTSEWLCESCPFETGYRANIETGATVVSDEAARYGNGSGYDDDGAYLALNGQGQYNNDGYNLDWRLTDFGLESRVATLEGGRQGKYSFDLAYRELPFRLFDTTQTIFETSDGSLTLPNGWTTAAQTSGMSELESSLRHQTIGSDRERFDIGGSWLYKPGMQMFARYNRQNKDGIDIMGGPGYTQASLLPRVIDFQTDQFDLGMHYDLRNARLTLAYHGSFFSNSNQALIWDTPFTTAPGATRLQMAQEPDNDFQQVLLSGTYNEPAWNTVVAFSAAFGQGEQDAGLLPYTLNPNLSSETLPRSSLNGKVDTNHYALTISSRPTTITHLKFSYRLDEYDNRSKSADWTRVIVDLFDSGETETNIPYGYRRGRLNLSARARLRDNLSVTAGYDRTDYDRDLQEVAEQTESGGWGQLRWQANDQLDVSARSGAAKRKINRYDTDIAALSGQNPLLRKYNLAYRYREFGELTANYAMKEKPVTFSATVYATDDSYTQSQLGMTSSKELRASADMSWSISDSTSTYLALGRDNIDARQAGSEQGSGADWFANHDDTFDHLGLGLVLRDLSDKIDLNIDYTRGNGETVIDLLSNSGGQSRLPNLKSKLDSFRVNALYHWSEKLDASLGLRYERFSSNDWALQDVGPATLPTVLTLGADPYNYKIWAVGLAFKYHLGSRDLALAD